MYGAEINTVRAFSLWPRSMTGGRNETKEDKKAKALYAQRGKT
jgi:hypothetical protein